MKTSRLGWEFGVRDLPLLLEEARNFRGESLWRDARRRLFNSRAARWSLIFLVAFVVVALIAPVLPIASPVDIQLQDEPQPPEWNVESRDGFGGESDWRHSLGFTRGFNPAGFWEMNPVDSILVEIRGGLFGEWQTTHWLGTDGKGRDLLARIIWGSRTSLLVALAATLCSLLIGVTYGALSGFIGGWVDNLMMRLVDVLYSIPFIFVVIFLITLVNEYRSELEDKYGIDREVIFYLVIGAIYWLTMARVVRGQVLSLKNSEFIDAAKVLGASTTRIIAQHLLPNVLSVIIVYLTLTIPAVMLFEAFLSFLGLGIEPPKVSWGLLAVDSAEGINPLAIYWWVVAYPALAMGSTLLALNILGDGLRDALDPKMRGKD